MTMGAEVVAVAAVAENGVIGRDGGLPWPDIEGDLRHFRETTEGHPVIMGRVTYESIERRLGGPLPGRKSIVLSRTRNFVGDENVRGVSSPGSALGLALRTDDRVYVAGGESVYEALLPFCSRMLLTEVNGEYEGDARFPDWDDDIWDEEGRSGLPGGYEVVEYKRSGGKTY